MSTDLTIHEPAVEQGTVELHRPDLNDWANRLQAAHTIGTALCGTAFAPPHFRGKPDEAAAAILYGSEVGFSPTQALRSIFIIGGSPGMYARQMVALVQAAGHEVWTVEKSDNAATVSGRRRGSEHVITETWTIDRAKRAGYTTNKKYQTDPQAMLYARAASDVCRQIAADALAGMAYSVEELEMSPAPTAGPAAPPVSAETFMAPTPPAPAADEPVDAEAEPDEPRPLTQRTRGAVFALLSELWPREDAEDDDAFAQKQRALIGWALGTGPIASRADLDEDMGQAVVDKFRAEKLRREAAAVQAGEA